jgi:hypothetical protein
LKTTTLANIYKQMQIITSGRVSYAWCAVAPNNMFMA